MPLKLTVDTIDEVPETLRDQYVEENGKFRLNVEGVEDVSGLKSALNKERGERGALAKRVKQWEALGKSPEEIEALLQKAADEDEQQKKKAGDFDGLLQQHKSKWEKEREELARRVDAAEQSERSAVIETRLMAALTAAGATVEGVDLLPDRLAGRIKFELQDGKRVLTILAADGRTPLAGSGADGLATFDDLVKESADKWPSLFKGSAASGGGKPASSATGGTGVSKRSDFKTERDRAAYIDKHGLEAYKKLPD